MSSSFDYFCDEKRRPVNRAAQEGRLISWTAEDLNFFVQLLLQLGHVVEFAGHDAFDPVIDDLGDRQAIVARIGLPVAQQRQLADGGLLVRVLL
jgi:hypothetical protein